MGNVNSLTKQFWQGDTDSPEAIALDELIESNNMTQFIDQSTNLESRRNAKVLQKTFLRPSDISQITVSCKILRSFLRLIGRFSLKYTQTPPCLSPLSWSLQNIPVLKPSIIMSSFLTVSLRLVSDNTINPVWHGRHDAPPPKCFRPLCSNT